ncbi:NUDIX hydrolase [Chloroflexota bacterium]
MKEKLRQVLSRRQRQEIIDPSRTAAAVLIPIYHNQGQYHILLIKRTEKVRKHKGQISFPGGVYEERDKTLLNTALRECTEEIGLLAEDVEILGELDDEISVSTNYVISPFLALIPWPYQLKADGNETEEIIEVPILKLLDEGFSRQEIRHGETVTAYYYHHQEKVIWGATARILNKFLDIFTQVIDSK